MGYRYFIVVLLILCMGFYVGITGVGTIQEPKMSLWDRIYTYVTSYWYSYPHAVCVDKLQFLKTLDENELLYVDAALIVRLQQLREYEMYLADLQAAGEDPLVLQRLLQQAEDGIKQFIDSSDEKSFYNLYRIIMSRRKAM